MTVDSSSTLIGEFGEFGCTLLDEAIRAADQIGGRDIDFLHLILLRLLLRPGRWK
jgi:hypothetical protein